MTFPTNWNVKGIFKFKGTDATDLRSLDSSVRSVCLPQGLPTYYGGTVQGSPDEGHEYVDAGIPGSNSNYVLGARVAAAIMNTFPPDSNSHRWFVDYTERGEDPPNCWKPATSPRRHVPDTVTEVSLYELLAEQYNPDDDVNQAYLELG